MKKAIFLLIFTLTNFLWANNPILITESTISLDYDQTEELFFSFAEGDIIDFEMVKGSNLKDIEVYELPNSRIFSEFKAEKFSKKQINVRNKNLYKFRFKPHFLMRFAKCSVLYCRVLWVYLATRECNLSRVSGEVLCALS